MPEKEDKYEEVRVCQSECNNTVYATGFHLRAVPGQGVTLFTAGLSPGSDAGFSSVTRVAPFVRTLVTFMLFPIGIIEKPGILQNCRHDCDYSVIPKRLFVRDHLIHSPV